MGGDGRQLGDVGSRLILENDRVKVWELLLEPGERSPVHQHLHDYLLVIVEGNRIAAESEPESEISYGERQEARVRPGDVFYLNHGGIETAVNVGTTRYREILIELK